MGSDQTAKQDGGHLCSFFYLQSSLFPCLLSHSSGDFFFSLSQVASFHTLNIFPCLLISDAEEEGELEPAKELIQPIAEKLMAKYKAKEEETPLLFFVAGEVR